MNYQELPEVVDWAHGLGARVLNVFFMVCTGRGEELTDITPAQYEEVLGYLVELPGQIQGHARPGPLRAAFQTAGV